METFSPDTLDLFKRLDIQCIETTKSFVFSGDTLKLKVWFKTQHSYWHSDEQVWVVPRTEISVQEITDYVRREVSRINRKSSQMKKIWKFRKQNYDKLNDIVGNIERERNFLNYCQLPFIEDDLWRYFEKSEGEIQHKHFNTQCPRNFCQAFIFEHPVLTPIERCPSCQKRVYF